MTGLIGSVHVSGKDARFAVYDASGSCLAWRQAGYGQDAPQDGWVEHDPAGIWRAVGEAIAGVLAGADVTAGDLAAIGVANQRDTTVVWNRHSGEPYHQAIGAGDRRTADAIRTLDDHADVIRKKTGLTPDALFPASRIGWILDHVDGARADAERGDALFGSLDSWLVWNLTGGPAGGLHLTDVTNGSRTMLMSLDTEDWDAELLGVFGVPRAMLPAIGPSCAPGAFGTTTRSGPAGAEIPVSGVLGEHQAALIGQQCFGPGEARYCCEASGTLILNTGTSKVTADPPVLTTIAHRFGGEPTCYALEGYVPCTGATIQWLVDGLGIIRGVGEIEAMARRADDPEGMYFVPAFTGLSVPRADLGARGVMVGLGLEHNQNHVARATLHALAYQARDMLEVIRQSQGPSPRWLRVDGNGAWFDMCMQIHADILGLRVSRPADVTDPPALGAAYAAGLAAGVWSDVSQIAATRKESHRWSPQWTEARRQEGHAGWLDAVQRSYGWADEAAVPRGDRLAAIVAAEWRAGGSR